MANKIFIGIDPDLEKSGFAVIEKEPFGKTHITTLTTLPFFDMLAEMQAHQTRYNKDLIVCIECGFLNKISNYHVAKNTSIAGRIGKNVGENHCISKLLVEFCERNNIQHKKIKPTNKKWDAGLFKKITGYEGRTNQETRDAVRAAWN